MGEIQEYRLYSHFHEPTDSDNGTVRYCCPVLRWENATPLRVKDRQDRHLVTKIGFIHLQDAVPTKGICGLRRKHDKSWAQYSRGLRETQPIRLLVRFGSNLTAEERKRTLRITGFLSAAAVNTRPGIQSHSGSDTHFFKHHSGRFRFRSPWQRPQKFSRRSDIPAVSSLRIPFAFDSWSRITRLSIREHTKSC